VSAEDFLELRAELAARFPKVQDQRGLQTTFEIVAGKSPGPAVPTPIVKDLGLQGYLLKTEDEKAVAQLRVDGFTFNRLYPYTSWEELFPVVIELWRRYSAVAKPQIITRLAVRYLNRIPFPSGNFDLLTYFPMSPVIPPELPQQISGFLTRVTIYDSVQRIAANVAQALESTTGEPSRAVILDIDAFKQDEYSVDDPAVLETLNVLRSFKNRIFFNSITDECLRQFE
jgi:uncharacterized protein (TIGR04255 family)